MFVCTFGDLRLTPLSDEEREELDALVAESDRADAAEQVMRSTRWQG